MRPRWFCVFPLVVATLPAQVFLSTEKALALAFPHPATVTKSIEVLSRAQRAQIASACGLQRVPAIFPFWTGRTRNGLLGYAVIDSVRGKSRPITYMVVLRPDLRVQRVELLVYRESHGGEIRRPGWRRQFEGRGPKSPVRIGRDIRNIAGATISCRAVTTGVRRILASLSVLRRPASIEVPSAPQQEPAPAPGGGALAGPFTRSRLLMGTSLAITLFAADERSANLAMEAAFNEVARLEGILSDWEKDSELSLLVRAAGTGPRTCSPELLAFLLACRKWTKRTGAAFDASGGRLFHLWREAARLGRPPSSQQMRAARRRSGMQFVLIDPGAKTAELRMPGMQLDPGGIGKGFALDRVAGLLRRRGLSRALCNFGGQLLALAPRLGGEAWRVRLRDPASGRPGKIVLFLRSGSLATTADTERGLVIGGERRSHVIDPRTGRPVTGMLGVTVFAATATAADALSTALFVMGFDDARRFARSEHLAVLLEASGGKMFRSTGFAALEAHGATPR